MSCSARSHNVKAVLNMITDINMTDSKKMMFFKILQKPDNFTAPLNRLLTKPAAHCERRPHESPIPSPAWRRDRRTGDAPSGARVDLPKTVAGTLKVHCSVNEHDGSSFEVAKRKRAASRRGGDTVPAAHNRDCKRPACGGTVAHIRKLPG